MFPTAETFYARAPGVTPAERPTVLHGAPDDVAAMLAAAKKPAPTRRLAARVNHGRWLVDCPTPGCNGAQYASKTDRRFFCNYCRNASSGGAWLDVAWPEDGEVAAIEKALAPRHLAARNWRPGETVADLLADNAARGLTDVD